MKIGFFDSGLGGITILSAVRKKLPQYDYFYFGDTKNLPYGDKSEEEIYSLTKEAMYRLFDGGALLVIIACNTASAETLRRLQDSILVGEYADRRILGVIIPTIETLIANGERNALLIGTNRTIGSEKYEKELEKMNGDHVTLNSLAIPDLVPLIESGHIEDAHELLFTLLDQRVGDIDTLILGCTHYTLLKRKLRERYGDKLYIISQDEIIPDKLEDYLRRHPEIQSRLTQNKTLTIELSKENSSYERIEKEFLNCDS